MPLPIWRKKGFSDDGEAAWVHLQHINEQISKDRRVSIYVHVPFCPSRCSFCDCLTMQVRNHIDRVLDKYLKALLHEIKAWKTCGTLSKRPVTTVHFGGGTPLFLGFERFQNLVEALRSSFNVNSETEWAIETTSASLNPPMLEKLTKLGFRRLHLGIQSMEDHVRPLLKRRESSSQVLEKIRRAHGSGWITSVDLLVGLP
ncbi:MAG: radical SAM protein, partial [Chloroflexota bacterium]|nr:radical SAM protein [Chloroflexota bacterium]